VLAERLLAQLGEHDPGAPRTVAREALDALRAHDWPGNVRELRNVLERAAYLARAMGEREIRMTGVPLAGAGPSGPVTNGAPGAGELPRFDAARSYRDTRAEWESRFERAYVGWLLDRHAFNISAAARAADMDRKYLYRLAKKHGLHPTQGSEDEGQG
jgi:DNA-binding NtrC family response regulator